MNCNLCGSGKVKDYAIFGDYKLVKCSSCRLLFTDQDSIRQKEKMYSEDYFSGVHSNFFADCKVGYEKCFDKSKKLQNFKRVLLKIKGMKESGKLLDIGCATGVFLDMAQGEGYNVTGVDVSEYACKYAKENFGIDALCGKLEDLRINDKSFDIITMWDLIEHVLDPHAFLKEVKRILKDDGLIFILTINDSSLMGWLAEGIYYSSFKTIKAGTKIIHPVHHNYHFKEKHLLDYLKKNGFEVIWREKSEMPVENIEGGGLLKIAAKSLYFFSENLNLQHEIRIIARKNE
jgi:2-polyprenyl-3-methyl-5-hydroxy-6-metoxy-1,4-benzoquinol methylase